MESKKEIDEKFKEESIISKSDNEFLTLEDEISTRPSWCDAKVAIKKIKNVGIVLTEIV